MSYRGPAAACGVDGCTVPAPGVTGRCGHHFVFGEPVEGGSGKMHDPDSSGSFIAAYRNAAEEAHHPELPAVTVFSADGATESETYFLDRTITRLDGPAMTDYRADGSVRRESYRIDGKLHRLDGPAIVHYDEDGQVVAFSYRRDGDTSRIDGPAFVSVRGDVGYRFRTLAHGDLAGVGADLLTFTDEEIELEVIHSSYAPLLGEGIEPRRVAEAIAAGVRTIEGIREMIAGAPAEWVRSFETAGPV